MDTRKRKYFELLPDQDSPGGVAYYADPAVPFFSILPGEIIDSETWNPMSFVLKDGPYTGFPSSDMGVSLISQEVHDVFQQFILPGDTTIQFLPAIIRQGDTERPYYVMHFTRNYDVLSEEHIFRLPGSDYIIQYGLDKEKVGNLHVFNSVARLMNCLISGDVAKQLKAADLLVGIELKPIKCY